MKNLKKTHAKKFRFKVLEKGRALYSTDSRFPSRFLNLCSRQIDKFLMLKGHSPRFYLWVGYGIQLEVHNKLTEFYNDGTVETKKDFLDLFEQFIEN